MVREEMTETMLETGLEATIGIPIPFVIVVATKNGPCLHEAVHLLCRLVKGLPPLEFYVQLFGSLDELFYDEELENKLDLKK